MSWLIKWGIKINETKSLHITFYLRPQDCPPITLNNSIIPHCTQVNLLVNHIIELAFLTGNEVHGVS